MKAAIIGAGAIGGFYGAALADAGMDVSFIARGKTLIAIREHGLRLVGNTELTLDVPVTDDAAEIGQVDVVLLCTKTFQVAEAARTYLPALMGPHTLVVTTQNGVIAPHELSAIIGPEHVAPGVCRQWVKIVEPGLIMDLGGPRMFEVSTIDDSPNTLVNELREACRKGGLTSPDVENITTTCGSRCVPSSPKEPVVQYSTSPWATSLVPTAMSSLGVSTKLFRWLALTAPGSPTTSSRRTSHSLLGRIPRQQPPSSATSLLDAPANTLLR
ncbi:2-dehydropantoate 2-reductase [Cutibacterium acnes P10]|nr:2-dehydropantoate 2-reductase [Cutibacterium acnes P10]